MSIIRNGLLSADLDVPVVLPTLNLDFANSQELDPRITFTRGSIGIFVNRNGLIETIAANQPRFDFDPISGECKGLLIEESRVNLLTYSNTFTNGIWNSSSVTRTDNVITSPDGTINAGLISNSGSTFGGLLRQYYTFSAIPYTFSCFVKKINWRYIGIRIAGSLVADNFYPVFDLDTKTFITNSVTGITLSYQEFPNGWYRISLTYTPTAGSSVIDIALVPANGDHFSRQGQGVCSAYVYGAQLEAGAFPTSYIPTVASTVTRSADLASMTGTNFSSWYNSSEGTLFVVASPSTNGAYSGFIYLLGTDFNNGIVYLRQSDYQPVFRIRSGQRDEYSKAINGAVGFGQIWRNAVALKSAISFKTNDFNSFVSGVPITGSRATAGTLPTFTGPLYLGGLNGSAYLNGTISRLTYYPKALSPSQLQYLTQ